jgi:hypothetical protein
LRRSDARFLSKKMQSTLHVQQRIRPQSKRNLHESGKMSRLRLSKFDYLKFLKCLILQLKQQKIRGRN